MSKDNKAAASAVINPHNPEFITKRPWYLGDEGDRATLNHQSTLPEEERTAGASLSRHEESVRKQRQQFSQLQQKPTFEKGMWVEALKKKRKPYQMCKIVGIRQKKSSTVATLTVQFEDGTEEQINSLKVRITKLGSRSQAFDQETYDSKRDRYHGYEISQAHDNRLKQKFEQRDELRRKMRQKEVKKEKVEASDSDLDSDVDDSEDDEFVQRDEDAKTFTSRLARQGGVGGAQMKVTARNLRIREDTAKYLHNLNPNSAYYDPKSRSMRDNPNPELGRDEVSFAGDNFARISGDAIGLAETQVFAWDASGKSNLDVHPQANPSQAELLKKQYKSKSSNLQAQQKSALLSKYGGAEYLDGNDGLATAIDQKETNARRTRFGVDTSKTEYRRDGRPLGEASQKRVALQSKYEEDVFRNGHTAVWGSYFHKGAFSWGYADDHSLIKNSYGTGANGRIANDKANEERYGSGVAGSAALARARSMLSVGNTRSTQNKPVSSSQLYGEADVTNELDPKKLRESLKRQQEEDATALSKNKKREYNSLGANVDVTQEDMEAYRLRKQRREDPMSNT